MSSAEGKARSVVIAVDPSPGSHSALNWALTNMCDSQKDILHIVHAYKPLQPVAGPQYEYFPSGNKWSRIRCSNGREGGEDREIER